MKNTYNSNIHKRTSIRLKGYDYSQRGLYFVTVCCHQKQHLFGDIQKGIIKLNEAGKCAEHCWLEIPQHFPEIVLHEYVVMPNHIHGIIEFQNDNHDNAVGANQHSPNKIHIEPHSPDNSSQKNNAQMNQPTSSTRANIDSPLRMEQSHVQQRTMPRSPSRTIGSVIRGFKIGMTKWIRKNTSIYTVWQRNYYEHIIRNESPYLAVSAYIQNNPQNWVNDDLYGDGQGV